NAVSSLFGLSYRHTFATSTTDSDGGYFPDATMDYGVYSCPRSGAKDFFNQKSTIVMIRRNNSKINQNDWHNGLLGTGHRAMAVLDGVPYKDSDPFILFMDDSLNLPGGEPVGGAHPHAGFETLSLVLEGNEKDWKTGSFELMTAG